MLNTKSNTGVAKAGVKCIVLDDCNFATLLPTNLETLSKDAVELIVTSSSNEVEDAILLGFCPFFCVLLPTFGDVPIYRSPSVVLLVM